MFCEKPADEVCACGAHCHRECAGVRAEEPIVCPVCVRMERDREKLLLMSWGGTQWGGTQHNIIVEYDSNDERQTDVMLPIYLIETTKEVAIDPVKVMADLWELSPAS